MYSVKFYAFLAIALALSAPISAVPRQKLVSREAPEAPSNITPSPPMPSGSAVAKAHHKVSKKVAAKNLSRRNPLHPDIIMKRDITGPLAMTTSLLNAADGLSADQIAIRHLLDLLNGNTKLGQTTEYQKQLSDQLAEWQTHANSIPALTSIQEALADFGRDKGMANLNKNNDSEVALKNLINAIKFTMTDLNLIAYKLPILGSTLGPIVYQIKCIVEELLNGTENVTDGLLNKLGLTDDLKFCSILSNLKEFC